MTKQERLVLLVVVLLVLSKVGFLARDIFIAHHYGAAGLPSIDKHVWYSVSVAWGLLVNVGAGVWLLVEARAAALNPWVWVLLGLCFGLLGVVVFYLVQLYARHGTVKT